MQRHFVGTKLFALSADLVRSDGYTSTNKMILGYRLVNSEEEAIGSFTILLQKDYKKYDVREILCLEIPTKEVAD